MRNASGEGDAGREAHPQGEREGTEAHSGERHVTSPLTPAIPATQPWRVDMCTHPATRGGPSREVARSRPHGGMKCPIVP